MKPLSLRPALIEQVYDLLVAAIAERRLAPGERLAQERLAAELGVSRQPVSHALALLKQQGLVVECGRRGLQVAPLDPSRLRALYQVRSALDGTAAGLAAARWRQASTAERSGAEASLDAGHKALVSGERGALIAADVAFHAALNRLSGNPVLIETAESQWPHIRRAMGLVLEGLGSAERVWNEHAAILGAVRSGEIENARALAQRHAARAGDEIWQRIAALGEAAA